MISTHEIVSDDTRYVHWDSIIEELWKCEAYGIPWNELEKLPHLNINNKKDQVN